MKPFDLAAAKAGAPVCTDLSEPVRILCFDRKSSQFPIIALIDKGDNSESFVTFTKEGKESYSIGATALMMRDDNYAKKLARGEYTPSIKEKLTVENPTCKNSLQVENPVVKENLTTDREYWRRVYAGQAMQGQISGYLAAGNGFNGDNSIPGIVAKSSGMIADALIAELEKTEK
mgnify:CR=1 FL=1